MSVCLSGLWCSLPQNRAFRQLDNYWLKYLAKNIKTSPRGWNESIFAWETGRKRNEAENSSAAAAEENPSLIPFLSFSHTYEYEYIGLAGRKLPSCTHVRTWVWAAFNILFYYCFENLAFWHSLRKWLVRKKGDKKERAREKRCLTR